MRPRLLLVPLLTEIEWVIKPQLEEWADVATFDVPGVGEPPVVPLDRPRSSGAPSSRLTAAAGSRMWWLGG